MPHDRVGLWSQICSHRPSTQRPMRQPILGMGRMPQDSAGLLSHICSQAPFTHRPMRQPIFGIGLRPQVRFWPMAKSELTSSATSAAKSSRVFMRNPSLEPIPEHSLVQTESRGEPPDPGRGHSDDAQRPLPAMPGGRLYLAALGEHDWPRRLKVTCEI